MKTREGFVSNSSSSSFIIGTKGELTKELLGRFLGLPEDSPYYEISTKVIDVIYNNAKLASTRDILEQYDVNEISELKEDSWKEEKTAKRCFEKNYKIYMGYVADDDYEEALAVPLEIDYEDYDIIMYKQSYY